MIGFMVGNIGSSRVVWMEGEYELVSIELSTTKSHSLRENVILWF